MRTLNVTDLPEELHRRIRIAAAHHGVSMAAFARRVLDETTDQFKETVR